jgi:diguanylate cyclase (GGDEF)-like protein
MARHTHAAGTEARREVVDLRRARLDEDVVAAAQVAVWALASELPNRPWAILDRAGHVVTCSDAWGDDLVAPTRAVAEIQLDDEDSWLTIATDTAGEPGPEAAAAARSVARLLHTVVTTTSRRRQAEAEADEAKEVAGTDPVTQVLNARGLWERLALPPAARTADGTLAVARLGLDDLRAFNLEHGYLAGDLLLRTVATQVRGCIGAQDVIARLGGAEFAVLVAELEPEELAARLRRQVQVEGATVWVGVARRDGDEPLRTTVARADLDLRQQRLAGPPA